MIIDHKFIFIKVLELTKPEEWTPHGMRVATKVFSSNLDMYRATIFYEKVDFIFL